MKTTNRKRHLIKLALFIALLVALLGTVTACESLGFAPASTPEESEPEPEKTTGATAINTKDTALLAVYQSLLDQADSYDAKMYLSEFYTNCDNWYAESEYFKDGSDTWHVVVDMTDSAHWDLQTYWQQASWFVFRDGKVIPSNLFKANALRIEADLQALSPAPKSESD